jgi:hypothetical protein
MDGNYVYAKRKIPEDAKCDLCDKSQKKRNRPPKGSSFQTRPNLP